MRKSLTLSLSGALVAALVVFGSASAQSVEGTITANGKATKMGYVTSVPGDEAEAGGPAVAVVFAEQAPKGAFSLDKLREGAQGDYLIATFNTESAAHRHDELVHKGMENVSSLRYGSGGFLEAEGLKYEGGALSGRLFTSEPYDFFGQATIEADLKFSAPPPQ